MGSVVCCVACNLRVVFYVGGVTCCVVCGWCVVLYVGGVLCCVVYDRSVMIFRVYLLGLLCSTYIWDYFLL